MKISVFEAEDWERKAFEKLKDNHELRFCSQSLEPENVTD